MNLHHLIYILDINKYKMDGSDPSDLSDDDICDVVNKIKEKIRQKKQKKVLMKQIYTNQIKFQKEYFCDIYSFDDSSYKMFYQYSIFETELDKITKENIEEIKKVGISIDITDLSIRESVILLTSFYDILNVKRRNKSICFDHNYRRSIIPIILTYCEHKFKLYLAIHEYDHIDFLCYVGNKFMDFEECQKCITAMKQLKHLFDITHHDINCVIIRIFFILQIVKEVFNNKFPIATLIANIIHNNNVMSFFGEYNTYSYNNPFISYNHKEKCILYHITDRNDYSELFDKYFYRENLDNDSYSSDESDKSN